MNAEMKAEFKQYKDTKLWYWTISQDNDNGNLFIGKSRLFSSKASAKKHFKKTQKMFCEVVI